MTTFSSQRQPEVARQTVAVIGGGAGIVLKRARRARAKGTDVILAGRNPCPPGAGRGRPAGTDRPCDGHGRRSFLPLSLGGLP
jgi:hypothetical protein